MEGFMTVTNSILEEMRISSRLRSSSTDLSEGGTICWCLSSIMMENIVRGSNSGEKGALQKSFDGCKPYAWCPTRSESASDNFFTDLSRLSRLTRICGDVQQAPWTLIFLYSLSDEQKTRVRPRNHAITPIQMSLTAHQGLHPNIHIYTAKSIDHSIDRLEAPCKWHQGVPCPSAPKFFSAHRTAALVALPDLANE